MVTVYKKSTGEPVLVAHLIDAKEYVAGGAYSWSAPAKKPEMPIKSEAKPAKIPTVEDKKPIIEKAIESKKPVDVVKPEGKPIIPKRIIRK